MIMTPAISGEPSDGKPCIFISYGTVDGDDLLMDLVRDLSDRYEVLYDRKFLRGGQRWPEEINRAILRSRAVILILTPHAVREGDDPSVCHNELLAAQAARIPIQPVMWKVCRPPLTANNLQHIDFQSLPYDRALAQLRDALGSILAGNLVRRVHYITEAWSRAPDFEIVLQNVVKPDEFQGRDWLFERIADWRATDKDARLLLLTADPGTGKSAIAAHFSKKNRCGPVLAAHFCGWQASATLEPQHLVRNLVYVLAQGVAEYRDALKQARRQTELEQMPRDGRGDLPLDDLLHVALSPLREMPDPLAPGQSPAWLVVDALDEAVEHAQTRGTSSILDLLIAELPLVPPWLRVLATSRAGEVPGRLNKVVHEGRKLVEHIHLSKKDSTKDLKSYIDRRLAAHTIGMTDADKGFLIAQSESNFLYVKLVLDALAARTYTVSAIRGLPPGLDGFYSLDFRRLYDPKKPDSMKRFTERARPLLGVLAVAQDDLSLKTLSAATGLSPDDVHGELRRLSAYVTAHKGSYSIFHKSLSDWLCDRESAQDHFVDEDRGHAALAGLCWTRFQELPKPPRGLRNVENDEIFNYLVRFGIDHFVASGELRRALAVLDFIFTAARQQRAPAVFADLVPGQFKRRVLRGLRDCSETDKAELDSSFLADLLVDFYQVEPLEAPIKILMHHHAPRWDAMQEKFLAAGNYVLRYAVSEAVADACMDGDPSFPIEKVAGLLRHENDANVRELGAYTLRHIYGEIPDWIEPGHLELMGESETYAGRSALGDLLLTLKFQQAPDIPAVRSEAFWNPIWDHNRLDIWDLRAADAFIAGELVEGKLVSPVPLPENADGGTRTAYDNFVATEIFRDQLEKKLNADPDADEAIKALVAREGFASLALDAKKISNAEEALAESPHLAELMRLFFSHPLWEVAENAASTLAEFAEKDFQCRSIVTDLFGDSYWRVHFGAIETAYQLVDFDRMTLFREAVNRFFNDRNSRVRALCAENLIAYVLDCAPAVRARYLEEFDTAVRRWIEDDDAWVLEHVLRLLKQLDDERPGSCGLYFADSIPPLMQGLPAPLPQSGWKDLSRADFLTHIEKRRREILGR